MASFSVFLAALFVVGTAATVFTDTAAACAVCTNRFPPSIQNGGLLSWCGTDGVSRSTTSAASACFMVECKIAPLHAGTCACPNNCTSGLHGSCHQDERCQCDSGWGGADCNVPMCPENSCSGHGHCAELNTTTSAVAACVCDAGWAGPACDVAALSVPQLPWGCMFDPVNTVPGSGCAEPEASLPFYDWSGLPQVRVSLGPDALASLFDPRQAYSEKWRAANITWVSTRKGEAHSFTHALDGSGIRIKGSSSRLAPKHSFKLRFHRHHDGAPEAHGWPHEASVKASQNLIGAEYITSLLLTVGVPVARSNMALLFVNDRFYGIYNMFGTFSHHRGGFIDYWYGGTTPNASTTGEFIKAGFYVHPLEPDTQHELKPPQAPNASSFYGRASAWLSNVPSQAAFEAEVGQYLDVETFARAAVVASLLQLADTVVPSGNNYQWFVSNTTPFSLSMRDFDLVFSPLMDADVTSYLDRIVLGFRLMISPSFVDTFVNRYDVLLAQLFPGAPPPSSATAVTPQEYWSSYIPFAGSYFERDATALLNHGSDYNFVQTAFDILQGFAARAAAVRSQLAPLRARAERRFNRTK